MDTIVDELNEGQYKELEKMWKTYVKSYLWEDLIREHKRQRKMGEVQGGLCG